MGRCGGIAPGSDCRQLPLSRHYAAVRHLPLRALAVVILIAAAGGVALLTTKGKATVAFAREARTEVRKVIWPTRQETLHTTLIVAAVTAVMSLILWGLDGILVRLVSFITGLRF